VCDFILGLTLRPAVDEFRAEPVIRLVDPAAGTGHFLVRAVDLLWDWYTTGTIPAGSQGGAEVTGGVPVRPAEAARRILAGVHGVELDPLTAAVARLRLTVAVAAKLNGGRPVPLTRIPHTIRPRVVVGDSLMLGKVSRAEYAALRPVHYRIHEDEVPLFGGARWPDDDALEETPAPAPRVVLTRGPAATEQLSLLDVV
jgi:hypothetical protein